MNSAVDFAAIREQLLGPLGVELELSDDFEEMKAQHGLGCAANALLETAVSCILVGLQAESEQLLGRARNWLTVAMDESELPGGWDPHGAAALRYSDLALATWLSTGVVDQDSFDRCVDHYEEYLKSSAGQDPVEIGLVAVDYVLAGRCVNFLATVQRCRRSRPGGRRLAGERQLAAWLCTEQSKTEEVSETIVAFLRKHGREWLTRGHRARFARWVMFWNRIPANERLDPAESLIECSKPFRGRKTYEGS